MAEPNKNEKRKTDDGSRRRSSFSSRAEREKESTATRSSSFTTRDKTPDLKEARASSAATAGGDSSPTGVDAVDLAAHQKMQTELKQCQVKEQHEVALTEHSGNESEKRAKIIDVSNEMVKQALKESIKNHC